MRVLFLLSICLFSIPAFAESKMDSICTVYLLHGQGSDYRIFQELKLGEKYPVKHVHFPVPERGMNMHDYAMQLIQQIDTTTSFALVGVSMGGMLSVELSSMINPEFTIIISSAKNRNELPWRYKFMKYFPLYKILPARLIKAGSFIAQPLFEPDRKNNKDTFVAMLKAKDPKFLKRSTEMIVKWNPTPSSKISHIHGTKDHTLPYRRIKADYTIFEGSHMMTLTQSAVINQLVLDILESKQTIRNNEVLSKISARGEKENL